MSMTCLEFRRLCGAEPDSAREDLAAHRRDCAACAAFAAQMQALDELIREALRIEAPELPASAAVPAPARTAASRPAWLGIAASLAAALGIASVIWLAIPRASLAHEVVDHVMHEPESLVGPPAPVAEADLQTSLAATGAKLDERAGLVRYAMVCMFRGRLVSHLVLQGPEGPVTVMLLPDQRVSRAMPIDEEGFRGTIVPWGDGSIAVLARQAGDVQFVKDRFIEALQWPSDRRPSAP